MKYLLDTNACIAALRGSERVTRRLASVTPDDCGVSMISVFELHSGVERCRSPEAERKKVECFLAPLHLLPFDRLASVHAARVRWHLEKQGTPIGPYDTLLAGQALSLDVALVTTNHAEFCRVAGLSLENWEE